jgi:hypothetical protein
MTKPLSMFLVAILMFAMAPLAAHAADDEADVLEEARRGTLNWLELLYKSYGKAKLDPSKAYKIPERTLEVAWGTIKLDGGWLIPLTPAEIDATEPGAADVPEHEWVAAVYVGEGDFHWDAPNETQQWILAEHLRALANTPRKKAPDMIESLDIEITDGVVLLLNGKWRDLLTEGSERIEADSKIEKAAKTLWRARGGLYKYGMARAAVQDAVAGEERDLLIADMASKSIKGAPGLVYSYDPKEFEPASIDVIKRYALNRSSTTSWSLGLGVEPEMVATMTSREIAMAANYHSPIDVQHYILDMTVRRDDVTNDWGMAVKGSMEIGFKKPSRLVTLDFINDASFTVAEDQQAGLIAPEARPMSVKYFRDQDGAPLTYLHRGHEITIDLGRTYEPGETWSMSFAYSGNFIYGRKSPPPIQSLTDTNTSDAVTIITYELVPGLPWYPSAGIADRYTFDWVLRLPRPMLAATSGTLVSLVEENKLMVHTIKEEDANTFPAIVFGNFNVHENDPDYSKGEIKVRLYTFPGFDKEAKSYIEEAESILSFYSAMFGPYPFSELDMAQMAIGMGFAQAPAGIIRVTGEVYISKTDLVNLYNVTDPQLRDYFIPHEIAHEWWGHKVDFGGWSSSRDQWISETFAEFSAALYVEERDARKSGDPTDTSGYDDRSADWRINRRGHKTDRTAPLWAGSQMGGYWTSTVYARGPLILDMLRKNFGKEVMLKVMYTWCEMADRNNGFALTEDFQAVLEQVVPGVAFDDFVDQFIKGNAQIPQ